ncbi:HrpT family type III secretion system protein [Mixta hanseatica]|uniref:Type III secretion protein HrpT n=1 Tax=Mixta hanseatica TaxID=2872648 RepID=A0ABY4RD65_9GAMM|nr:HrpT family type III secretion system protein [Mixta hanseatica]UQY46049.1 type III secretion protein HrpT [Mixta hanseatica]
MIIALRKLFVTGLFGLLLNACAPKAPPGCQEMSCRPQSDLQHLTIWWQPELRNGPYDYTQVQVHP